MPTDGNGILPMSQKQEAVTDTRLKITERDGDGNIIGYATGIIQIQPEAQCLVIRCVKEDAGLPVQHYPVAVFDLTSLRGQFPEPFKLSVSVCNGHSTDLCQQSGHSPLSS